MDELINLKDNLNADIEGNLTIYDFIIKASALTCKKIPEANASWKKNSVFNFKL